MTLGGLGDFSFFCKQEAGDTEEPLYLGWGGECSRQNGERITHLPREAKRKISQEEGAAHLGVYLTSLGRSFPEVSHRGFSLCASIEEAHPMSGGHGWGMASCVSSGRILGLPGLCHMWEFHRDLEGLWKHYMASRLGLVVFSGDL